MKKISINDIKEFEIRYNYLKVSYNKYSYICYLQNLIMHFSKEEKYIKSNINYIICEIAKIGYSIPVCENYNQLIIYLNNIKNNINNECNNYMLNEVITESFKTTFKRIFRLADI